MLIMVVQNRKYEDGLVKQDRLQPECNQQHELRQERTEMCLHLLEEK